MIPVKPSATPPEVPSREQRRRDVLKYGGALAGCVLGFVAGYLIRRSGWGGDFGTIIAFFSAVFALFCAAGLLIVLKK